ncbi:hypothetical protein BKA62DRAFT_720368, partial [Auriculariales sp. MPI-PUGE-AT-0066]
MWFVAAIASFVGYGRARELPPSIDSTTAMEEDTPQTQHVPAQISTERIGQASYASKVVSRPAPEAASVPKGARIGQHTEQRARRTSHRSDEERRQTLESEVLRLEGELRRAGRKAASMEDRLAASERRLKELNAAFLEVEKRLEVSKLSAAAARGFAEAEDVDGKAIVDLFNDFIEGLNDFVFCVLDKLDEKNLAAELAYDRVRNLAVQSQTRSHFLFNFLATMAKEGASVDQAVLSAMKASAFSVLYTRVFLPPVPYCGQPIDPQAVGLLMWIRDRISQQESQEKSGRWRAMTYEAMRMAQNDDALIQQTTSELFFALQQIISALIFAPQGDEEASFRMLFEGLSERTAKVIKTAIRIQDHAKRVYVSCDYSIYFPSPNDVFSPVDMEIVDLGPEITRKLERGVGHAQSRGRVLLPVSPGLRAFRGGTQLSGSNKVVKKP